MKVIGCNFFPNSLERVQSMAASEPVNRHPSTVANLIALAAHIPGGVAARASPGVTMSLKVVLAADVDSYLLAAYNTAWRSAGYIVVPAISVREASITS
jgi:hypothetical protein